MQILSKIIGLLLVALLTACGGGGAPGSTTNGTVAGGTTTTGITTSTTVITTTTIAAPTLALQIYNASNVAVTKVTLGGGNYAKATFKDASGTAVANKLVTFSLNGFAIATLSSLTALTNASGEAQVTIAPASVSSAGAATLSAGGQTVSGGTTYAASIDYAVTATPVSLGPLTVGAGSSPLSAGGNTSVTILAQTSSAPASGINVSFTASCGSINPVITTDGTGLASATYSAIKVDGTSCSGSVTLSASSVGASPRVAVLTVTAAAANAINFVSATPAQIFVKNSGATEQSIAKFTVLNSTGAAQPNADVIFSLTQNPGGVGLGASGATGSITVTSDSAGVASVSIFSGTIPGPVEVSASLASNTSVFTVSKNLTVASGPPSQDHFSLSVQTFNIEGQDIDGASSNLTVRVADRQGNPVPDGTVINFTAEGGQIATSCATARIAGLAQCTVAFVSQNPRPADGRISILAYAEGLKEYIDLNGDNAYTPGTDTLVDLGDAYRDNNENNQYDAGEFVIPKFGTTTCAGSGGQFPSRVNTCTGNTIQAATVRQQAVLTFATSFAAFTVIAPATSANATFVTVRANSTTVNPTTSTRLLPMPAGTTISATALSSLCLIGTISPSVVPNTSSGTTTSQLGSLHSIGLTGCSGSTINIVATSPNSASGVTTFPYLVP